MTTDAQVRKLMEEMTKHGKVGVAALRSGVDRKTARKYLKAGKLPSEMGVERTWRTRPDPFAQDWDAVVGRLQDAPELEARALFEDLLARFPGRHAPGQLRTFQRRVRQWRAQQGPPKEVFFTQQHRPGEAMQTDFTWASALGITIDQEPFRHMLCHPVLPYSNWEWATVCRSESLAALRRGVQAALFRLGRVPRYHQTDNSTAATHDLTTGKRGFNEEYLGLVRHFQMEPRTIAVGKKEQNGDVEALHRVLKRRHEQHLVLRGSRDFESVPVYEGWVQRVMEGANTLRADKVAEDVAAMRVLQVKRLPEYREETVRVNSASTIRVKFNTYSVPSRLIGERVRVRVYDDRLEILHQGEPQMTVERLLGRGGHRINYRHIIWSLVRKPGAFARYRYREDLFPSVVYRRAYDALCEACPGRQADLEYLRVLFLAATTMESEVETALELLHEQGELPESERVKALVSPSATDVPEVAPLKVDLRSYDALLPSEGVAP